MNGRWTNRDGAITLRCCHTIDGLRSLEADSVQCVVTSPPYWGLRDYGIEPVVWGGDAECEHEWGAEQPINSNAGLHRMPPSQTGGTKDYSQRAEHRGQFCRHCNAWLGCFGLEPTIELYVEHAVEVFREVRRVLRKDGVCFLNLGDSYTSGGRIGHGTRIGNKQETNVGCMSTGQWRPPTPSGLKPKDLCGIPWRVALALQSDNWWLRSDIIWSKKNCMPSSVKDRPTTSHEYIFLLTKSARYFWDQEAVREPHSPDTFKRFPDEDATPPSKSRRLGLEGWTGTNAHNFCPKDCIPNPGGRNLRSVWTIATEPYPEAHFATFPQELVTRCLRAGSKDGCLVLDPFAGSGTVGRVCRQMGLKFIGFEANPKYVELAKRRIMEPFAKSTLPKIKPCDGQASLFAESPNSSPAES